MKNAPPSLAQWLPQQLSPILAGCFTLTLLNGTVATVTDQQQDLVVPLVGGGSVTYAGGGPGAGSVGISGLKLVQKIGLDADQQTVTISWRPPSDPYGPSLVSGQPWATAIRLGLFDKASFLWGLAALASYGAVPVGWGDACPDGTIFGGIVTLFRGRVAEIKSLGAVSAQFIIKSDLVVLEQDMPHRFFQPGCNHTLYDGGCGLSQALFTTTGTVGAGSSNQVIYASAAVQDSYTNGTLTFTSGANLGVSVSIKYSSGTYFQLSYPLQVAPAPGDSFTVSYGCDKTMKTCQGRFNNLARFLGFPFVPQPEAGF